MVTSAAVPMAVSRHGIESYPVEFTGSGAEYFRVWIVNVLLSIITLGFYTPFARRRTAQYFYSHTYVAGSPLEFVAQQRKMVFGFLLMVALYLAYKLAVDTGQETASSLLLFGFAALAPYLWASAMRFRLGATRWRGVRLAFTAKWVEVYKASWPVFAIAAIWVLAFFVIGEMLPEKPPRPAGAEGEVSLPTMPRMPAEIGSVMGVVALAVMLTVLCIIGLEYNYRSLLVRRARIGNQAGRWKPVYMDFVRVWLQTVGFFLACLALVVVLVAALSAVPTELMTALMGGGAHPLKMVLMVLAALLVGFVIFVLISLPARAFREARMFQLVWNNVGVSQIARFKTGLKTGAFIGLRVRNMVLTLFTLGLFRPFAVASEYAAKVNSVVLHVKGGVDQLAGELVKQQGAFGDAAADALGLDLIG